MTQNQKEQLTKLLQEALRLIAELDCGPWECHACADTDDIAYIEVAIDLDGTARTLTDWAFALYTLAGLAHVDWGLGELYEAFRTALARTSPDPRQGTLPDWEEVEALMDEQARLRRIYANLLPFLETPAAYAETLHQKVAALAAAEGLDRVVAKAKVAADAMKSLQEELEMAEGEKATPEIQRMYHAHLEGGGDDFIAWFSQWLSAD
jgi:hypothetical protein